MRTLCTSLGSWDTIETQHKHRHGITFPLAILSATMRDAGLPDPDVWEGDTRPAPPPGGWSCLLISAMDSRHFWRIPRFLSELGLEPYAADRAEGDPLVIVGGQAATAPAPIEALVDVVYVGEAEAHAGELLATIRDGRSAGWSRTRILEACAEIPGCLVPLVHDPHHPVTQVFAEDIGVTLREILNVNQRTIHRVEIARGCASKCGFCALGWRSRYRENDTDAIAEALRRTAESGIREVHLSAGDAEGHSGISELRRVVRNHGLRDYGWTGRLDTMDDCSVSAGKFFAFGLEGCSERLRALAGKPKLTHAFVVERMREYYDAGGRRAMWHLIGGLPGETDADAEELIELLQDVARTAPEGAVLEVGRQPFGPLPHTPMQWFAPGLRTDRIGRAVRRLQRGRLRLIDKAGQPLGRALANTIVMRGGYEVTEAILGGEPRLGDDRRELGRYRAWCERHGLDPQRYLGAWDPKAPTPWEHVTSAYPRASLVRAYRRLESMVGT